MAMIVPRGRTTDAIAFVTFLCFLLGVITGWSSLISVVAGFIPAQVYEPAAWGFDLAAEGLPVWLRPLSATLVHSGWLHIALNLMILIYCGRQVEHLLGTTRLLILYVVGAYAAALAQWLSAPDSMLPMVGASGAISAVIGTYALIYSRREVSAIGPVPAQVVRILWLAAGWTVLQLLIGFAGLMQGPFASIAIWAHVGGFITGLLMARPMLSSRFPSKRLH